MQLDYASTLRKLLSYLLVVADKSGKWEDSRSYWSPMSTSFCVDLLLDVGFDLDLEWFAQDVHKSVRALSASIKYLDSEIRDNGRFGVDLWDAVKLGRMIIRHRLTSNFFRYDKLNAYIYSSVRENRILSRDEHWSGPAFYAGIVDYADLKGDHALSSKILNDLLAQQNQNGSWSGNKSKSGESIISPIYDTAQVVQTLTRRNQSEHTKRLEAALRYLADMQEDSGCWRSNESYEVLYTAWASLALSAHQQYRTNLEKALRYLASRITDDGRCLDLLGTIMFGTALCDVLRRANQPVGPIRESAIITNKASQVAQYEERIRALEADLNDRDAKILALEKKYGNADLVLSKAQIFFLGILLALIAALSVAIPMMLSKK